ncbi:MAG: hypothetical protein ABIJ34_01865 [archaeon]
MQLFPETKANQHLVYAVIPHQHDFPTHILWSGQYSHPIAVDIAGIFDFDTELPWIDFNLTGYDHGNRQIIVNSGIFKIDELETRIRFMTRYQVPMNGFSLYARLNCFLSPFAKISQLKNVPTVFIATGPPSMKMPVDYDIYRDRGAVIVKCHDLERAHNIFEYIVSKLSLDSF